MALHPALRAPADVGTRFQLELCGHFAQIKTLSKCGDPDPVTKPFFLWANRSTRLEQKGTPQTARTAEAARHCPQIHQSRNRRKFGLKTKIAKTYMSRRYDKLYLKTRADLVEYALASGLLITWKNTILSLGSEMPVPPLPLLSGKCRSTSDLCSPEMILPDNAQFLRRGWNPLWLAISVRPS